MLKILILGGSGMLGHMITRYLEHQNKYQITAVVRNLDSTRRIFQDTTAIIACMDCNDMTKMKEIVMEVRPNVCINCIGVIKQNDLSKNHVESIRINSLFPHLMRVVCIENMCRFIHFSTDCVFDGSLGNYTESDIPNARDLYGLTKLLGESHCDNSLTIRTSIIGPELTRKSSLLEWFLSQKSAIKGYTKAFFSGLTTLEIAKQLHENILPDISINGLYHLSGPKINKYELLTVASKVYNKNLEIIIDEHLVIDRSLRSDKYNEKTGYIPPSWSTLLEELRSSNLY